MPKSRRSQRVANLVDLICEAVKKLTAHRLSITYAAQWITVGELGGYDLKLPKTRSFPLISCRVAPSLPWH
jgi:hypothetical protein